MSGRNDECVLTKIQKFTIFVHKLRSRGDGADVFFPALEDTASGA